jgi:glutamyl-tRNA reductase
MQVAAGLDSLVLGEPQILGQIVAAHRRARVDKTTQQILSRLFEMAIRTGKRARTETTISANAASVSSIAVRLAASHLSGLEGRTVAVLGAGKMGRLTIQSLLEKGTHEILIASRTLSRAQTLAEQWQLDLSPTRLNHARLKAKALETLPEILTAADVIISSTSAPHIVLDCEAVAKAMVQRPERPLIIVDIALPRDVEPGVADLPGVHLYNIDNLEAHVAENLRMRAGEIPKVETIISEETDAFMSWYRSRSVVPTITAFRSEFEKIKEQELERTLKRLNHLAEDDQELVAELAHRLVNKFLHQPTVQLKEAAAQGDGAVMRETLHQLFELEVKSSK